MDITLLDIRRAQSGPSDYILIASANSTVHVKTLRDAVEETLEQLGVWPLHKEGKGSHWMALDYGGLLVHIFLQETREFYSLERLWLEARQVIWETPIAKAPVGKVSVKKVPARGAKTKKHDSRKRR